MSLSLCFRSFQRNAVSPSCLCFRSFERNAVSPSCLCFRSFERNAVSPSCLCFRSFQRNAVSPSCLCFRSFQRNAVSPSSRRHVLIPQDLNRFLCFSNRLGFFLNISLSVPLHWLCGPWRTLASFRINFQASLPLAVFFISNALC